MVLQYNGNVLKTSGSIVRVGKFRGDNRDDYGKLYDSVFNATDISKMISNVSEPIPIYVEVDLHNKSGKKRNVAGYALDLRVNQDKTGIDHRGFIFDDDAKKLVAMGYDKISPEIETVKDESGTVVDRKIEAICFVPSAAIPGNEALCVVEKFSSPVSGGNNMSFKKTETDAGASDAGNDGGQDGNEQNDSGNQGGFDMDAFAAKFAEKAKPMIGGMVKDLVDEAFKMGHKDDTQDAKTGASGSADSGNGVPEQKFELPPEVVNQLKQNNEVITSLQKKELSGIAAQLEELGIDNPSGIVEGLPLQTAIDTLSKLLVNARKANIQNSSIAGVPKQVGTGSGGKRKTQDDIFLECMSETGFNDERYLEMFR